MSLDSFLSGSIFAFIMIVARFGTAIMMMPSAAALVVGWGGIRRLRQWVRMPISTDRAGSITPDFSAL